MSTTVQQQTWTFRDAQGHTGRMGIRITTDDAADASSYVNTVTTALQAATNAHIEGTRGVAPGEYGFGYGSQAVFGSIEDKAQIVFTGVNRGMHRYRLPCPKAALFLTDGDTVDPVAALVAALISAILTPVNATGACDQDGTLLVGFAGGTRTRSRQQRRVNIFTKNPAETGPGE